MNVKKAGRPATKSTVHSWDGIKDVINSNAFIPDFQGLKILASKMPETQVKKNLCNALENLYRRGIEATAAGFGLGLGEFVHPTTTTPVEA